MRKICSLAIISLCLLLCGCDFLFDGGSGEATTTTVAKTDICLHDGTYSETFSVTTGKVAEITELTKLGYYLTGYYDQETGGTKYFSADGKSLSVWQSSYPKDVYAQYKPISEFSETFTWYEDTEKEFKWKIILDIDMEKHSEFANLVKGNTTANLELNFSFIGYDDLTDKIWIVYFKNVASYNESGLNRSEIADRYHGGFADLSSSYTSKEIESVVPASEVNNGETLAVIVSRSNDFYYGKIKNLTLTITVQGTSD